MLRLLSHIALAHKAQNQWSMSKVNINKHEPEAMTISCLGRAAAPSTISVPM